MKFDAQTAGMLQEISKMRQAMESTADTSRKLGEHTSKAGERFIEMGKSALEATGILIGVGEAMNKVREAWRAGVEQQVQDAEKLKGRMEDLRNTLAGSGRVNMLPQIRSQVDSLADSKVSASTLESMYGKISRAAGAKATPSQTYDALKVALTGLHGGMNEDAAASLGKNYIDLARVAKPGGGLNTAHLPEDAFDLYKLGHELSEGDLRLMNRSQDQALGLAVIKAGAKGDEGPKAMEAIMETLSERPNLTLDKLFNNPSMMPRNKRRMLENLKNNMGPVGGQSLGETVESMEGLEETDPLLQPLATSEKSKTRAAAIAQGRQGAAARSQSVTDEFDTRMQKLGADGGVFGPLSNPYVRSGAGMLIQGIRSFAGQGADDEQYNKNRSEDQAGAQADWNRMGGKGEAPNKGAEQQLQLLAEIRDAINKKNPGLSNHSEGQK